MAAGLIGAIVEAFMSGPEGGDYAAVSIAGVDPVEPSKLMLDERTFQYWPESISDAIEIGWNFKEIPGASHALAQWASNGGRTISFEVTLHRFMMPVSDRGALDIIYDPFKLNRPDTDMPINNRPHNVDVRAEIAYLRAYCYPSYKESEGFLNSHPPPISILCVPGSGLNENGLDWIYAVMTGCDVTRALAFPNGVLRRATVALTFKQVIQIPNRGIMWVGHGIQDSYKYSSDEQIAVGGDRPKNFPGW